MLYPYYQSFFVLSRDYTLHYGFVTCNYYNVSKIPFTGKFTVNADLPEGDVEVAVAYVYTGKDGTGNIRYYQMNNKEGEPFNTTDEINVGKLHIASSTDDVSGPEIKSITFDKKEAKPGDTVNIIVEVSDQSGVKDVSWDLAYNDGSDSVNVSTRPGEKLTKNDKGFFTAELQIDTSWSDGKYNIDSITAIDNLENVTTINYSQNTEGPDGFTVSGVAEALEEEMKELEKADEEYWEAEKSRRRKMDFDRIMSQYAGGYPPVVIENEGGENLTEKTQIELYQIVDRKEVKVDSFIKKDLLLNRLFQYEETWVRYASSLTHYRIDCSTPGQSGVNDYGEFYVEPGDYVIKCVKVPEGYEKFKDIKFTLGDKSININEPVRGIVQNVKANGEKVYIAGSNPDYIKEKVYKMDESGKITKISDLSKEDLNPYGNITDSYELLTIVLKKTSDVKKGGMKSANTGDNKSTGLYVVADVSVAGIATTAAVLQKKRKKN